MGRVRPLGGLLLVGFACSSANFVPPGQTGELGSTRFTAKGQDQFNEIGYPATRPLAVGARVDVTASSSALEMGTSDPDTLAIRPSAKNPAPNVREIEALWPGRTALYVRQAGKESRLATEPALVDELPDGVVDFVWVHTEAVRRIDLWTVCLDGRVCRGATLAYVAPALPGSFSVSGFAEARGPAPSEGAGVEEPLLQLGDSAISCNGYLLLGNKFTISIDPGTTTAISCRFGAAPLSTTYFAPVVSPQSLSLGITEARSASAVSLTAVLESAEAPLVWAPFTWIVETPNTLEEAAVPSLCENRPSCEFRRKSSGLAKVRIEVPGTTISRVHEVGQ